MTRQEQLEEQIDLLTEKLHSLRATSRIKKFLKKHGKKLSAPKKRYAGKNICLAEYSCCSRCELEKNHKVPHVVHYWYELIWFENSEEYITEKEYKRNLHD